MAVTQMRVIKILSVLTIGSLTACGSLVSNTDKPTGVYIAGAKEVTGDFGVSISEKPPTKGGVALSGISCKNKIWEAEPKNEVAISVLKREVQRAGYNTVFITSVEADPNALMKNCWSAIIANGIAFNL